VTRRGESKRNPVMLRTFATLSVNSTKHLDAHADRPFAAAQGDKGTRSCCARRSISTPIQADPSLRLRACPERSEWGDTEGQLRLMCIGADKSAMGAINRPLRLVLTHGQPPGRSDLLTSSTFSCTFNSVQVVTYFREP